MFKINLMLFPRASMLLMRNSVVNLCSRPSEDRTIPLSIIAERTKLSVEDVEHLLMKSLSVSESRLGCILKDKFLGLTHVSTEKKAVLILCFVPPQTSSFLMDIWISLACLMIPCLALDPFALQEVVCFPSVP